MKKIILLFLLISVSSLAYADTSNVTVNRKASNLYKTAFTNKYIETYDCSVDLVDDAAVLELDGTSGTLIFSTTTSCTVLEVFNRWPLPSALNHSLLNVSHDNIDWFTLNNLVTFEDNGKKLEMTGCNETPHQETAYITVNTDGIGHLALSEQQTTCGVSGVFERVFTGVIGPDTDNDGVPDASDAFPNDPAASLDTDGDGYPDKWNDGYNQSDSTTGLELDADPNDASVWQIGSFLYFPHVDSASGGSDWETEIGIINIGAVQLQGTLYAYNNSGTEVETKSVTVPVGGRIAYTVGDDFTTHAQIGYMKFVANTSLSGGYEKFYRSQNRVALPAVSVINAEPLNVSHIDSSSAWWTGIALVNTTTTEKNVTFTFSDASHYDLTLAAGQHWAGTIGSLPGVIGSNVASAQISNAQGVIGLELFGGYTNNYLSGILLNDKSATSLYYPHIASDATWWTGVVAYNPGVVTASLTISSYDVAGNLLGTSALPIPSKGKYIGTVASLGLPTGTAWFKLDTATPVTGFELFGTNDGFQLAGYTAVNLNRSEGQFAKIEKDGWTGIAFVNTSSSVATVNLDAVNDAGVSIDTAIIALSGNGKVVNLADDLFSGDISNATFIKFSSNQDVVGFQLNGASDGYMLDGLPGL